MTVYYPSSAYGITRYVSGQKTTLSYDSLQLFANLTQGGTVPFYVRYQYSWKYVEPTKGTYSGWGPLDETLDKIAGTPGLRCILNLAYAPKGWLAIDANGTLVGYGDANAVLPDGPAMATFATKVAQRYTSLINSGILILQICNEELDTALPGDKGTVGGTIGAHLFNYAKPAIKAVAPQATVIMGSVRPLSHANGGSGTQQWMNNFWNYKINTYYPNEPGQSIPDAHDFHYYRDSATITSNKNAVAPDPATTDNSDVATSAVIPTMAQVVGIMQGVISANGQSVPIWNLENGWNVPNNSPLNHNNSPIDTVAQQDRYTLSTMAQLWNAGATQYDFYSALTSGDDPRALTGTALTDLNTFISTNPQWTGAAPTQYLYTSVDTLDFWGTTSTSPVEQYFAIMNPTTSNKAWSISSDSGWLVAKTLPTNGIGKTNNANLTSGTLAAGQCITLKCIADSTTNGLSVSATTTGTLTVTVGTGGSAVTKTITVNLFTANASANPNLTSGASGPANALTFSINAGGSAPATQTFTFKNADSFATNWSVFTTGHWLSCATGGGATSGTLAAGATQTLTVTLNSNVSSFAPSLNGNPYAEVITVSATPHPTPYDNSSPPAATPYITIYAHLTVHTTTAASVQVSTNAMQYSAVASGSLPASQNFYFVNTSGSTQTWTATKTQSWLTLSSASGSFPKFGTSTGTSPNIQHTDYAIVTASINTTSKPAGTYTDTVTVTTTLTGGGTATQTIAVTYIVTSTGSTMTLGASPTTASLSQVVGGASVSTTTTLTNSGTANGTYSTGITYHQAQTGWLSVTPGTGTINGSSGTAIITLKCTPGTLAVGTYTASVLFSPSIGASTATVTVTFIVTAPPTISASPTSLSLSQTVGGANVSTTSTLSNSGASGSYTSLITYTNGSGWLSVSPASGTLTTTQVVTFTCATGALTAGNYAASVIFTLGSSTVKVAVTFTVNPVSAGSLTVSPTSLSLTGVQNGSTVSATSTLSNSGSSGTYTSVTTYTSANGSGWLTVSPSTTAITTSQIVTFTCNPGSMAPDNYTAKVVFTLGATTAQVNVTFTVSSSASPTLAVFPPSLTFTDTIGAHSAVPQTVTLSNTGSGNGTWASNIVYHGAAGNWIGLSPLTDTLNAGTSEFVTITVVDGALGLGTYTATITFSAGASVVSVAVTLIMSPAPVSFASSGSAQMAQGDLTAQYGRILSTLVGQALGALALTYYRGNVNSQIIYGELDGLFPFETASNLHVMKSINDVTAFLNAYGYVASVLQDAPVVYYRLGEMSGMFAYDISGRHLTATLSNTGGTVFGVAQGQAGAIPASTDTSYLFDGTSGFVSLPSAVNTANWPALSVEAFINLSNITFTQTAFIIANDAPLSTNVGFNLAVTKNAFIFRIGTGSTYYEINQTYAWAANTWYHLVGVFSGTSLTAYVNGNQVVTVSVTSARVAQTTNSVLIAAKPGSTANNFPGRIDEPSLFKSALTAIRVQAHYLARLTGSSYVALVMADNPQAYYRLTETSGTTAFDNTSNHFDATLVGTSLTYSQTGIITSDGAIGFGTTDTLTLPYNLDPSTFSALTLEYWIKLTGGYQHIVVAGDASGTTIYLNGAVYSTGSGDTVVVDGDVYYSGSFVTAGTLSQVSLYEYKFSAAQVANHYQVGSLGV